MPAIGRVETIIGPSKLPEIEGVAPNMSPCGSEYVLPGSRELPVLKIVRPHFDCAVMLPP